MGMMNLRHMVAEAVALGGWNLCAAGHEWERKSDSATTRGGGRFTGGCSQTVYQCSRCGELGFVFFNRRGE